ncbi:menaquinone-specific isochorismate synthase [Motilibacter peucedani]|uniref:isochorismate synthase n=1 Tax=Motilibacter peucedani TaxID=598650 RepID=A0A420XKY5_9ACTN|nr:isochorismate synthase [Motilibacter peucedani]RKS69200.1 menaquinone-specific isochorismate synthase [Motilibacter peucedani]
MTTAPTTGPIVARTVEVDDPGPLLSALPGPAAHAWVTGGEGIVGWGEAARFETAGPDRFDTAARWWSEVAADAKVLDEVGLPGTGLVAFSSFAFSDGPSTSRLVVPAVVVGSRDGRFWRTTVDGVDGDVAPVPVSAPQTVAWGDGATTPEDWRAAIGWVRNAIATGDLDKVVLALDQVATADAPVDARWLLQGLAERYPSCWAFAVDGLVGATPELLVRRSGELAESRVLAGTVRANGDEGDRALLDSEKDQLEHRYAVDSLVAGFAAHCKNVRAGDPYLLRLANVVHLATDVRARVADDASLLELAGALHPTAAVGGTPTRAAMRAIGKLERSDRGRYAGPVGWVDSTGDGELGLALRCAQLDGRTARLWAGCGIVGDSDPEAEAAEARAKFEPVRAALTRAL